MLTPEQLLAAHRAHIESLLGCTQTALNQMGQLIELNMTAAKASLSESAQLTQAAMQAKDAAQLLAMHSHLLEPLIKKMAVYNQDLRTLINQSSTDLAHTLQGQSKQMQAQFQDLASKVGSQATPDHNQSGLNFMKNMIATAGGAFDSVQKAARQLHELNQSYEDALADKKPAAAKPAASKKTASKAAPRKKR